MHLNFILKLGAALLGVLGTAVCASASGVDNSSLRNSIRITDWEFSKDSTSWQHVTIPNDMGQFVWTGFDYLGEPSPYDTDAWPSHSSYFGIFDPASLPKDRFWLYRSKWNEKDKTLHILPHWTWPGREGQVTPVFVYTDSPKAELFINGKSQGMREKNDSTNMHRYRLMWNETVYEPGEVKVVAYDRNGNKTGEQTIRTAGKADRIVLSSNRTSLDANGDPTSLRLFHLPEMDLFSGAATAIVQSGDKPGSVTLKVTAKGLKPASITIPVK